MISGSRSSADYANYGVEEILLENKFNLFDSVPLATLRFEPSSYHKRMT